MDIVEFLHARLGEREQWALAASAPYPYAAGEPPIPPQGLHWEWVTGDEWDAVTPDPAVDEYVAGGDPVRLASRETWPSATRPDDPRWQMRRTYGEDTQDMDAGAAGHIALNDPAYVLADIAAKRRILMRHASRDHFCGSEPIDRGGHLAYEGGEPVRYDIPCGDLRDLAAPFAAHPGYDPAWADPMS